MGPTPLLLLSLPLLVSCAPAQVSSDFRTLFDGESLAGWSGDERFWSVEDGVLVGESTAEVPCERSTYLVLVDGVYADFDLTLEFRIPSGNSGVQFRSQSVGSHVLAGYQADLERGPTHTGTLYEQFGRGVIARRGQRVLLPAQGAPQVERFADEEVLGDLVRADRWNRLRVLARGEQVRIEVNDTTTCEVTDRNARWSRSHGRIGLQLHEGPPMRVEFKNIRLRDLGGEQTRTPMVPPQWIWTGPDARPGEEAWLTRTFEVAQAPTSASLLGSADNRMEVYLNGELVALSDTWEYRFELDVREHIVPGTNVFTLWAKNEDDVAGLWLELRLRGPDGPQRVFSDTSWRWSRAQPSDLLRPRDEAGAQPWRDATSHGPLGSSPWGMPRPSPRGAPQAALAAGALELPDGFVAELVYAVPQARQGSWISLAVDPEGRIVAADQIGSLYRVTPAAPGSAETSATCERLDVDLGAAHGLTFAFGSLYAVVNDVTGRWRNGLYRLRDTQGDDSFDSVELLQPFEGSGEHGAHAVLLDPTGAHLYIVAGGETPPPVDADELARVVRTSDSLLPTAPDPNGHPPGATVSGGWVARTDAEARHWEVLAVGLRNPYDLAFSARGELFTVDSDMEWDRGLPWYRPTHVLQILEGADYGWRFGSGKWDVSWPDTLPPVLDSGPGSPTGMLHGAALAFPAEYRDALFVGDWAFGRIRVIRLQAAGGGYTASLETFLRGTPLPVCDLAVGPDGALYFVTGGRGLESAVYRVRWSADDEPEEVEPARAPNELDRLRAELASRAGDTAALLDVAWSGLASADPYVRHVARRALEAQPLDAWRARALAEREPSAAFQAWLALAHRGDQTLRAPLLEVLAAAPWDEFDADARHALLRVLDRALLHLGPPTDAERARLLASYEPRLPSEEERVDRALARLLLYLDAASVVPRSLERIERATSLPQAIDYGFELWRASRWTADTRERYFTWWWRTLRDARGGESLRNYLVEARAAALASLSADERRALGELAGPPPPPDAEGAPTPPEPVGFVRAWTRSDLEPELTRLGSPRDLARGERAFRRATCFECHRVGDEGGADGPDLTHAGARFRPEDLLATILEPSRAISDQYRDTEVWTRDGRLYLGVVLREDAHSLTVRRREGEPREVVLAKEDVELRRPTEFSRMPTGLLDTLELDEILDLFAYTLAERR